MNEDSVRIDDVSFLSPEDVKLQNTSFLNDSAHEYTRTGHESYRQLRHDIWVVRNGDIRKLLRRFPLNAPLEVQCALWMQAVVGKHFFPDANHRTAVVLLREILTSNYLPPGKWPADRTRETRRVSHRVRHELPPITLDDVYREDELYDVWRRFFADVLEEPFR